MLGGMSQLLKQPQSALAIFNAAVEHRYRRLDLYLG
jgi:hypothetical protein